MYRVWKMTEWPDGVDKIVELSAFNSYENAVGLMQEQSATTMVVQEIEGGGFKVLHVWNGHRELRFPR